MIEIRDFLDLDKLQRIQDNFSDATGLAAIAVDMHGEYLTEGSNFTDFCMKYTRGSSEEGNKRCIKCDNECTGVYYCHAGLMDFAADIKIGDEKIGAIIGGQILPNEPDLDKFRATARELGIDEEAYVEAVKKVPVSTQSKIEASAKLLEIVVNEMVNLEYMKSKDGSKLHALDTEVSHAIGTIHTINEQTHELKAIASKQKILALNASIEAARSGEAGVGFAVVAKSMGDLSSKSAVIYGDIEKAVVDVTASIEGLAKSFK